jgi:hypothetical protein
MRHPLATPNNTVVLVYYDSKGRLTDCPMALGEWACEVRFRETEIERMIEHHWDIHADLLGKWPE